MDHWEIPNKQSISYQQHNLSVTVSMISLSIAVTSNTLGNYILIYQILFTDYEKIIDNFKVT